MSLRSLLVALVFLDMAGAPATAMAGCKLKRFAELPVTMVGLRPMVHGGIEGADALFIADSGAFYSTLTPAAAAEFMLPLRPAPYWFELRGVGGEAQAWLTRVKTFTLFKLPIPNVDFLIAGNDLGGGAVGILGQNVFRMGGDVEYDLANGVIRLMRTEDCRNASLAYWATARPYSVIDIDHATPESPHTTTVAFLNDAKIRVMFDTGATTSVLTLDAANAPASPRTAKALSPPVAHTASGGSSWPPGSHPFPASRSEMKKFATHDCVSAAPERGALTC